MRLLYLATTSITACCAAFAAVMNFTHHRIATTSADAVKVPRSWIVPLGFVFLAAVVGLVVGFRLPAVGIAAATGLVLYFICALGAHLRVGDRHLGPPLVGLAVATCNLAVTLAHRVF